ncbi:hypothetical protein D9M70_629540 [compost metagenome]
MAQQVPDADIGRTAIGIGWREPGQVAGHPVIEPDQPEIRQPQHRRRHDRLGHRGQPEDRIPPHRHIGLAVRQPCGARVDFLAILVDQDHAADNALPQRGIHRRVHPLHQAHETLPQNGETL